MLEELLKKPAKQRRRIAFFVTGIIGILIFIVWFIVFRYTVIKTLNQDYRQETPSTETFRDSLPDLKK